MRDNGVTLLVTAALLAGCGPSATTEVGAGGDVSEGLALALGDVENVAVALEGYYRGAGYPTDLDGAIASLEPAGLELSPGNRIATYTYDAEAVEFSMCVETEEGKFATYDTAPMTLRQTGGSGGCPTG